ncbi:acyl-coenzyme A thioesterase 13-like [Atheta coriaria]|uniref:acyl-coenzyme A thioesterase 13-like n=1 Tax=Dalotia coriaria TaxID=877792 RepID=UPI0031F40DFE
MPKAQWLNQYLKSAPVRNGFDKVLRNVNILQADQGSCVATVKVTKGDVNPLGALHGGYMKGVKVDDEVKLISKLIKAGKSFAFLDIELRNLKTDQLLVKAEQTKFKV